MWKNYELKSFLFALLVVSNILNYSCVLSFIPASVILKSSHGISTKGRLAAINENYFTSLNDQLKSARRNKCLRPSEDEELVKDEFHNNDLMMVNGGYLYELSSVVIFGATAIALFMSIGIDSCHAHGLINDASGLVGSSAINVDPASISSSSQVLSATEASAIVDYGSILEKASKKALGGGRAGASAAVVQVCSLMWLRTAMNYQYRYGGNLWTSLQKLYAEGGIPRFYQGLPFAIFQGPLTRFGDTAANVGMLAFLESVPQTAILPLPLKTAAGSVAAGLWRIILMPIDTSKTAMQVEGVQGLSQLKEKVIKTGNPSPLYQGSLASAAATAVGHFPWFLTYNFLSENLPLVSKEDDLLLFLARSAACGLAASCVSDITSNSLRVIKTTKQTGALSEEVKSGSEKNEISYKEAVTLILEDGGFVGLFTRGLGTRLLTNAIQGAVFSVLLKYFQAS